MSDSAGVAITTVLSILAFVDIAGNILVCAIIKRNRDMRTPINCLLVNLAAADIIYAMFIIPKTFFKLIFTHPDRVTGTVLCKLVTRGNFAWVGGHSSIITLIAIAIERYYAVVYPFGNKWKLTKRKLKVIIPGSWLFAIIVNIPLFLIVDIEMEKNSNFCVYAWSEEWMGKAHSWALLVLQTALPLSLMAVLYSRVVYTLWFKGNDENQLTSRQRGVIRVRRRVTLMVLPVTAIFGICWGAESVEYVLRQFPSLNITPVVIATVDTMVAFNAAVNPFVYALLNQQFREKMKKMICCTGFSAPVVHPTPEAQDIELADSTTHPTHTVGPCSTE
ncbi:pyroglutamylated RF-amide peptide receptor-like [Oculina patagonica]